MFDGNFREAFDATVRPTAKVLTAIGISPDLLTVFGVGMAGLTGFALSQGNFWLGFGLLIATGFGDALDGAVANAMGKASIRGAYFDSVSDRLSDALLFVGLAWYYAGTDTPRMAVLPLGIYVAASLVSYQRAKAESLGFDAKGGLMERAERFIVLGAGLVFNSVLEWFLWAMLLLTIITAAMRFRKVWIQATEASQQAARSK